MGVIAEEGDDPRPVSILGLFSVLLPGDDSFGGHSDASADFTLEQPQFQAALPEMLAQAGRVGRVRVRTDLFETKPYIWQKGNASMPMRCFQQLLFSEAELQELRLSA